MDDYERKVAMAGGYAEKAWGSATAGNGHPLERLPRSARRLLGGTARARGYCCWHCVIGTVIVIGQPSASTMCHRYAVPGIG